MVNTAFAGVPPTTLPFSLCVQPMKLPVLPYDNDHEALVKIQALVGDADKDLLMTVIPDRGLYTLLLQHVIQRTADFIRHHDLEYGRDGDAQKLLDYITENPFRRPAADSPTGQTHARDVSRGTAAIRSSLARLQDKSAHLQQGAKDGRAKKGKGKVVTDKHG